jgi:hypothetical protein
MNTERGWLNSSSCSQEEECPASRNHNVAIGDLRRLEAIVDRGRREGSVGPAACHHAVPHKRTGAGNDPTPPIFNYSSVASMIATISMDFGSTITICSPTMK